MTKSNSIRSAVNTKFVEMLPQLAVMGGKKFRRIVLDWSVETLAITMAAAATHYNHAFHRIKESEPELVQGLGRPEGKNNGGRKRKGAAAPEITPGPMLLLGWNSNNTAAVVDLSVLLQAPLLPLLPEAAPAMQLYTVTRCKDGAEVASGLSLLQAQDMIAKAAAGKKAKLQMV